MQQHGTPHTTTNDPGAPVVPTGALARLQRTLTIGVVVLAVLWLLGWWRYSVVVAVIGFWAIALSYTYLLAIEFVAAWYANRNDPAPRAGVLALLRAWLVECTHTPRVFHWRQPFFSNAVPDRLAPTTTRARRGVVLVHGFVCNRGFWNPWLERLQQDGRVFVAVTLEPVVASIDDYVPAVEHAVRQVTRATGGRPPLLVCHSMGGLVARAWLASAGAGAEARVHRIVTIGSPHQGTWLGNWSLQKNGRQMRRGSDWIAALRGREPPPPHAARLFTCWYSNCDNIVFPTSTATLPGADNRFLPGVPHVAFAFRPEVMRHAFELLEQEDFDDNPVA